MDYDFVPRLKKSLEDLYQTKFAALFNTKDPGDLREIIGQLKAIGAFGDLISQSVNPTPLKLEEANDE